MIKLHLGCGPHIKAGWENYDIDPGPGGKKFDLRYPLPFDDNAVDFIYTEHFIEHLTMTHGRLFIKECFRVLKPGGVIRVSTPDLYNLLDDYAFQKTDRYKGTWEPATPCQMVNEGMRLWGHEYLYDGPELYVLLDKAGFNFVIGSKHGHSGHEELRGLEVRPDHNDLIVEAVK